MEKRIIILSIIVSVLLSFSVIGCSNTIKNTNNNMDAEISLINPPSYTRKTTEYRLKDQANPYSISFFEYGFAYYTTEVEAENTDSEETYKNKYDIYLQLYDSADPILMGSINDGYIADLYISKEDNHFRLYVFSKGKEALLTEYDELGNTISSLVLDDYVNKPEFSKLSVPPDHAIVIGMENEVVLLKEDGTFDKTIKITGRLSNIFCSEDGRLYGIVENNDSKRRNAFIYEFERKTQAQIEIASPSNEFINAWLFEKGFAYTTDSFITAFEPNGISENIVDLSKQNLFGSHIKYIGGSKNEIKIISSDESAESTSVYMFTLNVKPDEGDVSQAVKDDSYAEDGRKIVKIIIPKDCIYRVDYHAKKYNQISDTTYVEVEKLDEPLEDYLGKGNRPDIIMFEDNTEVQDYVNKGILEDLIPLVSEDDQQLIDDIIPQARAILNYNDENKIYALGGTLWMMLVVSNGEENINNMCTTIDYLRWYDSFLTERHISGVGNLENLLYSSTSDFYDEETRESFFESDDFKSLMQEYKKVYSNHTGPLKQLSIEEEYDMSTFLLARGPQRQISYGRDLYDTSISFQGIPCKDGSRRIYMKIYYPMGILTTSDRKPEAADFIMYFSSLEEYCDIGSDDYLFEKSTENLTRGMFSIYQKNLDSQILKTEKSYGTGNVLYPDGSVKRQECYYTQEQCEHLLELIEQAIPDTKEHIMIYNMMLDEMDGFWNGNKDIDSCCKVLQNRVELYLNEQKEKSVAK